MNEQPATPRAACSRRRRSSRPRGSREVLRAETVGGLLLMLARSSRSCGRTRPGRRRTRTCATSRSGPTPLHLHLSLATWAADGLLAIFFFVAGLELKREFVAGDLRDPRRAALPVAAAVGGHGRAGPGLRRGATPGTSTLRGWAIPTATDIAFAVAVLAVISSHLPSGLRTFLLTLAVVDDLLAITVIAVFYTDDLAPRLPARWPWSRSRSSRLVAHAGCLRRYLLLPLALATWALVHASGVHATVAGSCSASRSRYAARPTTAAGWPSISSTWSGRSRPGWQCRSSRSSPPG